MREQYIPPRAEAVYMAPDETVLTGSRTGGSNEGWTYEDL